MERERSDGQGNLAASAKYCTGVVLIPKLDPCCFFALEFCLEGHFPLLLTLQAVLLLPIVFLSPETFQIGIQYICRFQCLIFPQILVI